jgi:hypothetical protein
MSKVHQFNVQHNVYLSEILTLIFHINYMFARQQGNMHIEDLWE